MAATSPSQEPPTVAPRGGLSLIGPDAPARRAVEAFIDTVYRERFGATVRAFAPQLVALSDAQGHVVAAAGYRGGGQGPLFLERYLSAPVEHLLASPGETTPERAGIVEVGHLSAIRAGEGSRLITALGRHLAAQRFQWVVSTLTQELRQLFVRRLGITPLALAAAHPDALGEDAADWGRYYEHAPVVLAGRLDASLRTLAHRGLLDSEAAE